MMRVMSRLLAKHFIIGGAQRSATTYLTQILGAHPSVERAQPVRPEPKFFLKPDEISEGYDGYIKRYFSHVENSDDKILGEKSTSYIEYRIAAERIKEMLPDVKLIFLLRDPIERAISNINFSRMHGFEDAPLEVALLRELDEPKSVMTMARAGISVSPQAYLARSDYAAHLKCWYELFDRVQIKILIKETLTGCAQQIRGVYEFLDIDPDFIPLILDEKVNESQKRTAESLSDETLARLKAYFEPKNKALSEMCEIDFNVWNEREI